MILLVVDEMDSGRGDGCCGLNEVGFMFFNRMSDDGGRDCRIFTGGEIGKFLSFCLLQVKRCFLWQ